MLSKLLQAWDRFRLRGQVTPSPVADDGSELPPAFTDVVVPEHCGVSLESSLESSMLAESGATANLPVNCTTDTIPAGHAMISLVAEGTPLAAPRQFDASADGLTAELQCRASLLASELPNPAVRQLLDDLTGSPTAVIRQLPAAAQRALALTQLTDPPVQRLTEVFEEDPTLAQALLAQANSGLFGAGRPCVSVRDAVLRLGVGAVRGVLLGHAVSALLCRPGAAYAPMVADVWSHMVRTAPIARRLASPFNADPEEAFSLGLLHDAGKLIVFDRLTTLRIDARRDLTITPAELGRVLRDLHEPLGGLAAHSWGLGASAAEAIATHHRNPMPRVRNALSEVLFVAEAADMAAVHGAELDLAALWDVARLGGSAVRVERVLMAA